MNLVNSKLHIVEEETARAAVVAELKKEDPAPGKLEKLIKAAKDEDTKRVK